VWFERAALLVAEDKLTDDQIAAEVGIARRNLTRWKTKPAFAARVNELRAAMRKRIERVAIADQAERVKALDHRWHRLGEGLDKVLDERGVDSVRRTRRGSGDTAVEVEEIRVDPGVASLAAEIRSHEEHAAKELGQWQVPATGEAEGAYTMEELLILYRRATTRRPDAAKPAIDATSGGGRESE
jgi:hypothetical protein